MFCQEEVDEMTETSSEGLARKWRQPKQARSLKRVNRILAVAEEMFIEKGNAATTTKAIASQAEVQRRSPQQRRRSPLKRRFPSVRCTSFFQIKLRSYKYSPSVIPTCSIDVYKLSNLWKQPSFPSQIMSIDSPISWRNSLINIRAIALFSWKSKGRCQS